jgi:hypothetical protein
MARDDDYDDDDDRPRRRSARRERDYEDDDEYEDRPRRRRRRRDDDDDDIVRTLVPTRNPKALVAYYCGIFGLIPVLGFILGPIALLFGILGLRHASMYRKAKGGGHAIAGLILGPLGVLLSIVEIILFNAFLHNEGITFSEWLSSK